MGGSSCSFNCCTRKKKIHLDHKVMQFSSAWMQFSSAWMQFSSAWMQLATAGHQCTFSAGQFAIIRSNLKPANQVRRKCTVGYTVPKNNMNLGIKTGSLPRYSMQMQRYTSGFWVEYVFVSKSCIYHCICSSGEMLSYYRDSDYFWDSVVIFQLMLNYVAYPMVRNTNTCILF